MDVSVVCSTFGNYKWQLLAQERALPAAKALGVPVIYNHIDAPNSLHEARNLGLSQVETEYVAFLDADDSLELGYFDEMEKVEGDLRAPAVRYVPHPAKMPRVGGHTHACVADCLMEGNYLVVGTVARTELLREVGGWRDWPIYEDFDLFQRCWIAGATIVSVPKAIYVAHSTELGRNKSMSIKDSKTVQYAISKRNLPGHNFEWLKV